MYDSFCCWKMLVYCLKLIQKPLCRLAGQRQEAPEFDADTVRAAALSNLLKDLNWKLTREFARLESSEIAARLLSSWLSGKDTGLRQSGRPAGLADLRQPMALLFHGPHFRNLAAHLRYPRFAVDSRL